MTVLKIYPDFVGDHSLKVYRTFNTICSFWSAHRSVISLNVLWLNTKKTSPKG